MCEQSIYRRALDANTTRAAAGLRAVMILCTLGYSHRTETKNLRQISSGLFPHNGTTALLLPLLGLQSRSGDNWGHITWNLSGLSPKTGLEF